MMQLSMAELEAWAVMQARARGGTESTPVFSALDIIEQAERIIRNDAEKMRIVLEEGAVKPTRAHETDAGLDLYAREEQIILDHGSAVFDTGVHAEIPRGCWGKLESKSGLNVRYDIVSCGGTIDEGYTGSIRVKLYNMGSKPYLVKAGDKICQLVIMPYVVPELEVVEALSETERGENGFGSTGR